MQVRALLDPATIGVACTASISRILVGIPYRTLGRHLTRVVRPTGPLSLVCRLSPATVWENKRLCLSESGAPSLCKSTHPGLLCWLNTVFFVGRLCIARWALFMGQSGRHGRLWSRTQQALNPIGAMQLVLIFTLIGAALAAARQYLLYNVRQCRSCRGFGIQRYGLPFESDGALPHARTRVFLAGSRWDILSLRFPRVPLWLHISLHCQSTLGCGGMFISWNKHTAGPV